MNLREVNILLVEDNPADVRLMIEAIEESKFFSKLNIVSDGEAAMEFLQKEGEYKEAIRPDLIILDLNIPKKDGEQVLREIREDENLKFIPVAVLSISTLERDEWEVNNLDTSCFFKKPNDFNQFIKVVGSIRDFWLAKEKIPSNQCEKHLKTSFKVKNPTLKEDSF